MLDEDDLDAAVSEGIITAAQLEALRVFVGSRRLAADRADEERFRFMRGFNDFFFAVGIVLFGVGVAFFADKDPLRNLLAAIVIWGLAEFLVRRMRLVLPGILLVCLFGFFAFRMTQLDWSAVAGLAGLPFYPLADRLADANPIFDSFQPIAIATKALAASIAATLFYLRFRLPFALLIAAGGLVLFLTTSVYVLLPVAVRSSGVPTSLLVLLACGLGVFAAAMTYDLADRARTTRYADCAFWLHLLAAPLIVHSVIQLIVPSSLAARLNGAPLGLTLTTTSVAAIFAIVALLAAVAILIDRRALLVSALVYLGVAIGYAISSAISSGAGNDSAVFFATLVILGAMVLALGVGWRPLRQIFLRLCPSGVVDRLPPAAYAA